MEASTKQGLMKNKNEQKKNNLIEIVDQNGVETGVEMVLKQNIALLPESVATDRIKASAGFYISNRKDLMGLNNIGKLEMLYGVLKEAMLNLEAGTDYDIIPFKGKPTVVRSKNGWFKIVDLIKPAEIIRFTNNVVTKGDDFYFNPATEELNHVLVGTRGQNFEDIEGAYAYIKFKNGFEKTVYLSKEDLKQIRDMSPSGNSEFSPWTTNAVKMCKTKVVKELAKELCTLWSGRLTSVLTQIVESDEVSIKSIDERGNIINDDSIYKEPITVDAKEVSIDEL